DLPKTSPGALSGTVSLAVSVSVEGGTGVMDEARTASTLFVWPDLASVTNSAAPTAASGTDSGIDHAPISAAAVRAGARKRKRRYIVRRFMAASITVNSDRPRVGRTITEAASGPSSGCHTLGWDWKYPQAAPLAYLTVRMAIAGPTAPWM